MPLRYLIGPHGPTLAARCWMPLQATRSIGTFGTDAHCGTPTLPTVAELLRHFAVAEDKAILCLWLGYTDLHFRGSY